MALTFIAFEGYDLIATVSEEVRDPRRTIPKAILYSLGITMFVYLSVVFVSLAAVPVTEGLKSWQLLGKYGETGIIKAAEGFMPAFGVFLVLAGGLFATLSALNATILASSRVAFSMGRDWMLPHALSQIHPVRKTPIMAISITGLLFLITAVFLPIETLGNVSSLLFLLTFSMVNMALLMYRWRSKELPPFHVPWFPLIPLLGIGTCLGLSIYQLFNEPIAWALAVIWIIIGLVIFAFAFSRRATIADVPRVIESPELLALKNAKNYKVLLPLANPDRVESLINMATSVAKSSRGEVLALGVVSLPNVTTYTMDQSTLLGEFQLVLNKAQQLALAQNISFTSLLKIGRSAADEIIQTAQDNICNLILLGYKKIEESEQIAAAIISRAAEHDLLVLGMREDPWLQSFFFGTVSQQVAGQVECPTLLVKARAAEKSSVKRLLKFKK